jgi:serine/threonine protein kinase/tetratricopeptide (TPR) repeat protein
MNAASGSSSDLFQPADAPLLPRSSLDSARRSHPNNLPEDKNGTSAPIETLTPGDQERLASALEGHLLELERGQLADENALIAAYPELAEPLRACLAGLHSLHRAAISSNGSSEHLAPLEPTEKCLGDYRILTEISRGGMGVVYEARQISLGRKVALKVLPFAALLDQKQIARFNHEAQAAAQLNHPNIVPIFAVGCERGVHYYSMKYIEGQAVDQAIRELRDLAEKSAPPGSSAAARLPGTICHADTGSAISAALAINSRDYFRTVADLGIQAAEALHHAHQYGIIHRDVKPSNLLLDVKGKLWVTDFGLARLPEEAGLTKTGDTPGTLQYMSPEQAGGRSSLIDPRTDVYSLGITLYELLTLQPAFEGDDRQELVRRIVEVEPTRPRRINTSIPLDLETIVLKAISKNREERYSTAQELADDLRRFREGMPTLARRPTLAGRIAKWGRRHRRAVRASAAVAATMVVGLIVAIFLIVREAGHTEAALKKSEENLARADKYFRQARQVVDQFGIRHAEQLADLPGAEPLRQGVLGETLSYYQQFIQQADADPSLRSDLATTYFKMGAIREQLGGAQQALSAYRRAEALFKQLAREQPADGRYLAGVAVCQNNIGWLLSQMGNMPEARTAYRDAITTQERLVAEHDGDARYRSDLALTYGNLGLLEQQTGDTTKAAESFGQSLRIQEDLVRLNPENTSYQSGLAVGYNNLAYALSQTKGKDAERCYQAAIDIQKKLAGEHSGDLRYARDLALSYNNLGALEAHLGLGEKSKAAYREAITTQEQLVRKAPAVVQFRRDLAVSNNNLGRAYSESGDAGHADEYFHKARAILEKLVKDYPDELNYRSSLAGVMNNCGMMLEQLGRFNDAASAYRQAIDQQLVAFRHAADVTAYRELLSKHYWNYGRVLRAAGRPNEAAEAAIERKKLWKDNPQRLYWVAVELALAVDKMSDKMSKAQKDPATKATAVADQYAGQAVATLGEAARLGFAPLDDLRTNPDLKSIRQRPEFKRLMETAAR